MATAGLGLHPGAEVWATVKAAQTHACPDWDPAGQGGVRSTRAGDKGTTRSLRGHPARVFHKGHG
ncbi:TOBE domain-containing protein [Actinacidiphila glaucinigra]|uniref:TOBE domain-containing protein n=1 Tax=Actinacidiphila glaucinigra TaxID=235986 RepID=A0A239M982_9ACTN|nr:TOBE domain-containing protein [Actinacidiphila glaucinigra]